MLRPDRYPMQDFFVLDVMDVVPRSDMASMEHPLFSLSTKPERRLLSYANGDTTLKIMPSYAGLPTIFDKDLLIYCISHLVHHRNQGRAIDRHVRITTHDFLKSTNRDTSGAAYQRLEGALLRLRGTTFETNITTGDIETVTGFSLIDEYQYARKGNMWRPERRLEHLEITLSEWLFRAVDSLEVLALNRDYFRIRSPLDRRLYELARKHCGSTQQIWRIGAAKLQLKTGSKSTSKEFARHLRGAAQTDALPDYAMSLEADGELVVFQRRRPPARPRGGPAAITADSLDVLVPESVLLQARAEARQRNRDFQALKHEFVGFMQASGPPANLAGALLGFVRKKSRL